MRVFFLFFVIFCAANGFSINHPFKLSSPIATEWTDDPGKALFLTPLIEKGDIENAQKLAKVPSLGIDVNSYAGLITVNKTFGSNMFFWYFEAENDPKNAPVLIWLQGGPGASSLFGLFTENGPFEVGSDGKLSKRKYSWSLNHHLIFIDNPVGTGFSFTEHDLGYATTEEDVAANLYETMRQFYALFPHLKTLPLFLSGESYAGKYVPAFGFAIDQKNEASDKEIVMNLQGMAIGNAWSDPLHQVELGDYLFELGLIDKNTLKIFHEYEKRGLEMIRDEDYLAAFMLFDALLDGDMTPAGSIMKNATGITFPYNYLAQREPINYLSQLIGNATWRKAIHVGDLKFNSNDNVNDNAVAKYLMNDVMKSVAPWTEYLLNKYRMVFYNGQLDLVCPYQPETNHLENLKFNGAEAYKTAERMIWKVGDDIAGYVKEAGNLVEVLVRDSGHMVPTDQPKWAFDLITRVTHGKGFSSN
ncbi:venom serine carboxypeptidase-like [Culicoides brevitarsis]|uniref:venom serine carboxypeptidase-like n=1 Tax=Culicoides brevitarsis TaxID=469753 RepID=UPI00307C4C47